MREGSSFTPPDVIPAITSSGIAVGSRRISNEQLDGMLDSKPGRPMAPGMVDRLMRMQGIGIHNRNWVSEEVDEKGRRKEALSDLAARSLLEALANGGKDIAQLRAVYVGSSSGDMLGVSTGVIVQDKAGGPEDIMYGTNSDACPGWIHAAQRAVTTLSSPYGENDGPVAAVGAEVISPFLSRQKGLVSALFGDAAGTTIWENVQPDDDARFNNIVFAWGAAGRHADDLGIQAGGSRMPASADTVARDLHGVDMNTKLVGGFAPVAMAEVAARALAKAGLRVDDVNWVIPHQANEALIMQTAKQLDCPPEKVYVNIGEYGNTSSASIPLALHEAIYGTDQRPAVLKRNDVALFVSFGAGIGYAAMVAPMAGLSREPYTKSVFQSAHVPQGE